MASKAPHLFGNQALLSALETSPLFKGFLPEQIKLFLSRSVFSIRSYPSQSIIAFEDEECTRMGIIFNGSVKVERILPSGKTITLDTLGCGASFGEALVFADLNHYPATIQALEFVEVLYLSKTDIIHFCRESDLFLTNFSQLLSNRLLMLNEKVRSLSFTTVRQRVVNYLLEEYRRQKSPQLFLQPSRRAMADFLGIPRPSLSRELAHLQADGLIKFRDRDVFLLSIENLEQVLLK